MVESDQPQESQGDPLSFLPAELALWLRNNLKQQAQHLASKIHDQIKPLLTASVSQLQDGVYLRVWRASILYLANVLASGKAPLRGKHVKVPLTHILRAAGADLFEFFREMPAILNALEPILPEIAEKDEVECIDMGAAVSECKAQLVVLVILARKYKAMFCEVFEVETRQASSLKSFKLGWMLLILTKGDLEKRAPEFAKVFGPSVNSLQKLSEMNKLEGADNLEQIDRLNEEMYTAISGLLQPVFVTSNIKSETSQGSQQEVFSCACDDLLSGEDKLMAACLEHLDHKYEELFTTARNIDERDFIVDGFIPEASPSNDTSTGDCPSKHPHDGVCYGRGTVTNSIGGVYSLQSRSLAACLQSPMPIHLVASKPAATPVSEALNSMAWLKGKTSDLHPEPSECLLKYFRSCAEPVATQIQNRAVHMASLVFPKTGPPKASTTNQKFHVREEGDQGIVVYYRVLESILEAEKERTGKWDFTSLLNSHTFHVALLTCSFEIIVKTYEIQNLEFPRLLDTLQLNGFDFSKVIEPFVKHVKNLPTTLKRHLFLIEEQIIESMAWRPGSSIYPLIAGTCQNTHSKQAPNGTLRENPSSSLPLPPPTFSRPKGPLTGLTPGSRSPNSAFKVFQSPLKKGGTRADVFSATPPIDAVNMSTDSQSGRKNPAKTVLDDFFRKVLKLTAFRLHDMRTFLMIGSMDPTKIVLQVYNIVQHALYEQTHLFYNRHLDQILLSALYGVCKANQLNIHFMDIIAQYRALPRNRPEVYKTVVLEQSYPDLKPEKYGDIIEFYNNIFVPNMKTILLDSVHVAILSSPAPNIEDATRKRCLTSIVMEERERGMQDVHDSTLSIFVGDKDRKKIHNVNVSLAKPKSKEGSLSCAKKTMHAFVGKNKHPYQTPAQDLSIISARLNQWASSGVENVTSPTLVADTTAECGPASRATSTSPDHLPPTERDGNNEEPHEDAPLGSAGVDSHACDGYRAAVPRVETEARNSTRSSSVVSSTGSRSPIAANLQVVEPMQQQCMADDTGLENRAKRQKTDRCGPWDPRALRSVEPVEQDTTQVT